MNVTTLQNVCGNIPVALIKDEDTLNPYDVLVYNEATGAILYQESLVMCASSSAAIDYARFKASTAEGATAEAVMAAKVVARPFRGG